MYLNFDASRVKWHCVFYGEESCSGVLEWSYRVESWKQMLEWISRLFLYTQIKPVHIL